MVEISSEEADSAGFSDPCRRFLAKENRDKPATGVIKTYGNGQTDSVMNSIPEVICYTVCSQFSCRTCSYNYLLGNYLLSLKGTITRFSGTVNRKISTITTENEKGPAFPAGSAGPKYSLLILLNRYFFLLLLGSGAPHFSHLSAPLGLSYQQERQRFFPGTA